LLRDIAKAAEVPYAYLAKRMPDLANAGLVSTKRGLRGGITLTREPQAISLMEVSEAVDARMWLGRCLLGLEKCSDERSCPMHTYWKGTRQEIERLLRTTTLADVSAHERTLDTPLARMLGRPTAPEAEPAVNPI
jgi:Rrf2 family protein